MVWCLGPVCVCKIPKWSLSHWIWSGLSPKSSNLAWMKCPPGEERREIRFEHWRMETWTEFHSIMHHHLERCYDEVCWSSAEVHLRFTHSLQRHSHSPSRLETEDALFTAVYSLTLISFVIISAVAALLPRNASCLWLIIILISLDSMIYQASSCSFFYLVHRRPLIIISHCILCWIRLDKPPYNLLHVWKRP